MKNKKTHNYNEDKQNNEKSKFQKDYCMLS